jgi:hypothetical protein
MIKMIGVAKDIEVKRAIGAINEIRKDEYALGNGLPWAGAQLLGIECAEAACS